MTLCAQNDLPACGARARGQRGSAILIMVFFAALMIITAGAAMPNLLTQGQRDREEEMIWRGKQYARAVKLFYRKNGRFPQSMDDLVKPQQNVRFLRQAYEDPMNKEDGTWRLIYVGPNGQLMGSTTRANMLINFPQQRPTGGAEGQTGATGLTGATGAGTGTAGGGTGGGTGSGVTQTTPGTLGSGPVLGGNIIGVGSKVAKSSIKVYNGAQIYRDWEFLWDPTQDAIQQGQPGAQQPGTPAGQPQGGPQVRPPGGSGTGVRRP